MFYSEQKKIQEVKAHLVELDSIFCQIEDGNIDGTLGTSLGIDKATQALCELSSLRENLKEHHFRFMLDEHF